VHLPATDQDQSPAVLAPRRLSPATNNTVRDQTAAAGCPRSGSLQGRYRNPHLSEVVVQDAATGVKYTPAGYRRLLVVTPKTCSSHAVAKRCSPLPINPKEVS
jgi:hypothetical protein